MVNNQDTNLFSRVLSINKCYNIVRSNEIYFDKEASKSVQAFINNISFPTSLDELLNFYIYEHGTFNIEDILVEEETYWTVPKWAKAGDIVFFMHSKTAISKITALKTKLMNSKGMYSENDFSEMLEWIERGRTLYRFYGGKIFAIGRVSGIPEYFSEDDELLLHWGTRIYADIDSIMVLENPVDISKFNDFILVSRGSAITGVFGNDYKRLIDVIGKSNKLPRYVTESISIPIPINEINKNNWIELAGQYRRSFFLEIQFRSFYVNYLLPLLGDQKKIYRECRCCKDNNPDSFVDNIIKIKGKYLPVEVKLDINAEADIKSQVTKYCNVSKCFLDQKSSDYINSSVMYTNNTLIIDTYKIYMYTDKNKTITEIYDLDNLKTKDDIDFIKNRLLNILP